MCTQINCSVWCLCPCRASILVNECLAIDMGAVAATVSVRTPSFPSAPLKGCLGGVAERQVAGWCGQVEKGRTRTAAVTMVRRVTGRKGAGCQGRGAARRPATDVHLLRAAGGRAQVAKDEEGREDRPLMYIRCRPHRCNKFLKMVHLLGPNKTVAMSCTGPLDV